jgi:hypothetical protein
VGHFRVLVAQDLLPPVVRSHSHQAAVLQRAADLWTLVALPLEWLVRAVLSQFQVAARLKARPVKFRSAPEQQ